MSVIYYLLLIDLTKTSFPPTLSYPLTMSPAWKWTVELHSVYNTLSLPLLHGHSLLYVAPSHGTLSFLSWSCVGFPQDKGIEHCSNTALSWGATLQVLLQHSPQTAAPSDILLMLIECFLQKTLCMSPFNYFFAYFSHIRRKKKKKGEWS